MIEDIQKVFKQECSSTFIDGRRRSGKTNFALLLLEDALSLGLIDKVATNINIKQDGFEQIPYYDDLEEWARTKGMKGYLLDEIGKHLNRVRFMTELSKLIFDVIQLAGHYDLHILGCCPTEGLVDKLFLNTDILDLKIKKRSRQVATIKNYVTFEAYSLTDIEPTSIKYNSKDIAKFELSNPDRDPITDWSKKPRCCQCADLYLVLRSYRKVGDVMRCTFQNVGDMLDRHAKHTGLTRLKVSSLRSVGIAQGNS